jgi:hypothetical protein
MSLSAWEQQALDSIKDGLAGSDPDLAALLCAFTWLASGEERPASDDAEVGVRRAVRRLRRARRRSNVRRVYQRLGLQRAALLLLLLMAAALIAVALAVDPGGGRGRCTEVAMVCIDSAREHGSRASRGTATRQQHHQPAVSTPRTGPLPVVRL